MEYKILRRAFAALSFILASVVYLMTVQPTVPFWDCGEFSAASIWQQVPHPPGAPLFLMIGKFFHTFIPFGDPGWRVNLAAVFSSAFTVMLLYLITVKVINHLRKEEFKGIGDALAVYGSAFVGAAALTFSDTFWFNAVESEVYATSVLFVSVITYLMMKWNEKADEPGHERYLLLIAYLIGLSTGVHLLAILTVFSITLVVFFRKYAKDFNNQALIYAIIIFLFVLMFYIFASKALAVIAVVATFGVYYMSPNLRPKLRFSLAALTSVAVFYTIYPVIVKWIPAFLAGHSPGRNEAMEYSIEGSTGLKILAIGAILAAIYGLYHGVKKKKNLLALGTAAFLLMIAGYTTYTQILLRSNANPPMNENTPKDFTSLSAYLGREQYGDAPTWPRRYQSDDMFTRIYNKRDENGNYVYGEWFPPSRKEVRSKDGGAFTVPEFDRINTMGELKYMWGYQMDHMYFRYFGWNFIGRASDVQDAPDTFIQSPESDVLNHNNGYADEFPIRFFAIPFIIGLIGLLFHFWKDERMALVYLVMFLLTGVIMALAQNQQDPQPRERDYFYAASFMVWALWIGVGTYGLIWWANKKKINAAVAAFVILAITLVVPANMAANGWKIHSRAGNFVPFDYSYNILQSTDENAILFTNGDNDTFPLWYLQDVAGVRRDVRIVNLSLGNTLWYVDQLKNQEPWGAEKIPLSFSDESLRVPETHPNALSYDFGEAQNIEIPVRKEIMEKFTSDSTILANPVMRFRWEGKPYREMEGKMIYILRVQDKLVLDILQQIKFERPVYYSNTVGPDAFCGLQDFFRIEGMAMRICPIPQGSTSREAMDPEIMEASLMNYDNSDNFHTEPHFGFKFRNLNNPDVYYDEVHRRLMSTYRHLFLSYATYMKDEYENDEKASEILNTMNELISPTQFPYKYDLVFRVARLYHELGNEEQARKYGDITIQACLEIIENEDIRPDLDYQEALGMDIGPYRYASNTYQMLEEYDNAIDILQRLYDKSSQMEAMMQAPQYEQERRRVEFNKFDLMTNMDELRILQIEQEQGVQAALDTARGLFLEYSNSNNEALKQLSRYIGRKVMDLEQKLESGDSDEVANTDEQKNNQ